MHKSLRLIAGIASLVVAGCPALAQVDIKSMSLMDGQCRAEIEARAVPCTPTATFVQFGNGRSMLAFSREGVLYSFSGSRIEQHGAKGFTLIVDMIRIASEKAPDRDFGDSTGECVVETSTKGGAFTAIACDARSGSRSGRYRFNVDHISNFERKAFR